MARGPLPALTLGILRARPDPDERLDASILDTAPARARGGVAGRHADGRDGFDHGRRPSSRPRAPAVAVRRRLPRAARLVLASVRTQARRNAALATPTLIVGAGNGRGASGQPPDRRSRYGLRPVGFLDADPMPDSVFRASTVPVLGGLDSLDEAIRHTGARRVILAFSSEPDHVLVEKVRECEELGVEVSLVPRMFEAINERAILDHLGGLPLITLRPTDPRGSQFAVKHALDRSFAMIALVALAPVMGAVALAVRLSSPGPVLFRQRRVGRDGRVFDVLKFRTMREPAAVITRLRLARRVRARRDRRRGPPDAARPLAARAPRSMRSPS